MNPLLIVGTGAFGQVARLYFETFGGREVVSFAVDSPTYEADELDGLPICDLQRLPSALGPDRVDAFVAIGYRKMNLFRKDVTSRLRNQGYSLATFVYPGVHIWDNTRIGSNVFIFEDNTVQPFTRIGDGCIFWSGNHIGHHSVIGAYSFISSHVVVSGSCRIGERVFLGVNSTIQDGIVVGDEALIGAGVLVSKDLPDRCVVSRRRDEPRDFTSDTIDF